MIKYLVCKQYSQGCANLQSRQPVIGSSFESKADAIDNAGIFEELQDNKDTMIEQVISEYTEKQEQVELLHELICDYVITTDDFINTQKTKQEYYTEFLSRLKQHENATCLKDFIKPLSPKARPIFENIIDAVLRLDIFDFADYCYGIWDIEISEEAEDYYADGEAFDKEDYKDIDDFANRVDLEWHGTRANVNADYHIVARPD